MTSTDLHMVLAACKTLTDHGDGIISIQVRSQGPVCHLSYAVFAQLMRETGASVRVEHHGGAAYPWNARFDHGGVEFLAVLEAEDLPKIGYHIPDHSDGAALPVKIV